MTVRGNARRSLGKVGSRPATTSVADQLQLVPPAVRVIVQATRRTVKAAAPTAEEVPYQGKPPRLRGALWKIVRYALGDADVVGIGASATHVLLYFYQGTELDDGSGLLQGGGKVMRSILLTRPQDAERPDVRRMLRRAFKLASERTRM
jgi:hypothetical protein